MTTRDSKMRLLTDFDFSLPKRLIAQRPLAERDQSRLLVLDRASRKLREVRFSDLDRFLYEGDLLVLNDTKVIPARLFGKRATGGKVEILILEELRDGRCHALLKPLGRLKESEQIFLGEGFSCRLIDGRKRIIGFEGGRVQEIIQKCGTLALPAYIRRAPDRQDFRRYQTVYARKEGAIAAPTAGLHFTKRLLSVLRKKGVRIAFVTLHVNYGTFAPVRSQDIRKHRMHREYYEISSKTVRMIREVKRARGRIFAVGTTVLRALEDDPLSLLKKRPVRKLSKWSRLFIYPGFRFRVVDRLITNLHLPRTTLLMLACAFGGSDLVFRAYRRAVRSEYRFFSYGDAMLIL